AREIPKRQINCRDRAQFHAIPAEVRKPLIKEAPVRLDEPGIGPQQTIGHPLVNEAGRRLRRVIRLAESNGAIIRRDAYEHQPRHDLTRNDRFDPADFYTVVAERSRQVGSVHAWNWSE